MDMFRDLVHFWISHDPALSTVPVHPVRCLPNEKASLSAGTAQNMHGMYDHVGALSCIHIIYYIYHIFYMFLYGVWSEFFNLQTAAIFRGSKVYLKHFAVLPPFRLFVVSSMELNPAPLTLSLRKNKRDRITSNYLHYFFIDVIPNRFGNGRWKRLRRSV